MLGKAETIQFNQVKTFVNSQNLEYLATILPWLLLAWTGRQNTFVRAIFVLFALFLSVYRWSRLKSLDIQPNEGDFKVPCPNGFIRLARPRTHDTSETEHHTSIWDFGADLNNAVGAALLSRDEIRYSRVMVLLLSWADDDLGVDREINRLEDVFANRYNFEVENFKISRVQPDMQVTECVMELIKKSGRDTLLIVYYGGHGRGEPYSTEPPIWFPNRLHPLIILPSSGIQRLLEEASPDVLLLCDCCHAATVPVGGSGNGGVTEVIAACGYETTTPEVDEHSFTNALLAILNRYSDVPFSVGRLHSRILKKLRCWEPEERYIDGERLRPWQPRRTPVYTLLSETRPRRSIVLGCRLYGSQ